MWLMECILIFDVIEDLWESIDEASKKPVAKVMTTWTKQMGYPVLTVEGKQVIVITVHIEACNVD